MADPQAPIEHHRPKSNAASAAAAEPRSFDEGRRPPPPLPGDTRGETAVIAARAAEPLVEGGRQLAEQGRRASRQMAEAWRHAADPFLAMQYDASQWFDDMFRQTFGFRGLPAGYRPFGQFSPAGLFGMPPAEMKETKDAHLLAVELPGLTRDDVELTVDGDMLVVSGHKLEESDDASASYRMSERRYGRFERSFPLPADVDRAKISARFRDGLLKITLPKDAAAAQPHTRIEIGG
jgi:HSP20 family protein